MKAVQTKKGHKAGCHQDGYVLSRRQLEELDRRMKDTDAGRKMPSLAEFERRLDAEAEPK